VHLADLALKLADEISTLAGLALQDLNLLRLEADDLEQLINGQFPKLRI
jgi:hypothetical protein